MADPMTPEHLAAIRARLDAATAGTWMVEDDVHVISGDNPETHVHIADMEWLADTDEEWREFAANAAFVAAARQDVPALLDEVERLAPFEAESCALADQRDEARTELEPHRRALTFLTEVITGAALIGADDAIGMIRELVPTLVDVDALTADQAARVKDGLAAQQAERDRLAEQAKRRASFEVGEMGFDPDPKWRRASEIRCTACGAMIAQAQNFEPTLAELDALADRHQCLPRFDGPGASE